MKISVFPLFGVHDGRCDCGNVECSQVGKHILYDDWASLPAGESVRGPEGCNYAVRTGRASGILVVDCDTEDAAAEFADKYLTQDTYAVKTSRGYHFYFLLPDFEVHNSQSKLLPKVDIRGENGWVVAPDSVHRSGHKYRVASGVDPQAPPPLLLSWLQAQARGHNDGHAAPQPVADVGAITKAGRFLKERARVALDGGAAFFDACQKLVHQYRLDDATATQLIQDCYNPRCKHEDGSPYPWSNEEIAHKLEDARNNSRRSIAPDGWDLGKNTDTQRLLSSLSGRPEPVGQERAEKLVPARYDDIVRILREHEDWRGVFRFDVLAQSEIAVDPPFPMRMQNNGNLTEGDIGQVRLWFACPPGQETDGMPLMGYSVKADEVRSAILSIAQQNPFNPVCDFLDALQWDGVERLAHVHDSLLRSPDGESASRLFTKHMVAAVRRIRAVPVIGQPSRPVDHQIMLVLYGAQDAGKTRLIRNLAVNPRWYMSTSQEVRSQEFTLKARGRWLIEMEEMSTARKTDRDALKAFISAADDCERGKYERRAEYVQRSFVLFGTANELDFNDPTGMRRLACIRVGQIDHEWLTENRDQLWAEASRLAASGFSHHLDDGEKDWIKNQNASRFEVDDPLAERLAKVLQGVHFITMNEAYRLVMQAKAEPVLPYNMTKAYTDAFHRLRIEKHVTKEVKGWRVPDKIACQKMSAETRTWLTGEGPAARLRDKLAELVHSA